METTPQVPKTKEEQMKFLATEFKKFAPNVLHVGKLYQKQYPFTDTNPEVIDAVTVSIPLRQFMLMSSICMLLVLDDIKAEALARQAAEVKP